MSKFIVQGGEILSGATAIQGSKNASFAAIAATILTDEACEIRNVPDIVDVHNFLAVLGHLGAEYEFQNHILKINTRNLQNRDLPPGLVSKTRGSVLFAGPLLARFGRIRLPSPGGDAFGRPIDVHLEGFKALGAKSDNVPGGNVITAEKLRGAEIVLPITTVTGTENLILAAVTAEGATDIRLAACEPHVRSLCEMLNSMGADISGVGSPFLAISGVQKLRGVTHTLPPDEIATITFAVAGALTHGQVTIRGVHPGDLDAPLATLKRMNVNFQISGADLAVLPPVLPYRATKITTGVFPQLLTDDQPIFGVLATQSIGETSIHDWVHEGRLGYLAALRQMGAKVELIEKHRAKIFGPTPLSGTEVRTPDLRAGASILLAALVARGTSVIYNAETIDRGYERIDEKLRALGAKVERVE